MNTAWALDPSQTAIAVALAVAVQVAVVVLLAHLISRTLCRGNPAAVRSTWHAALVCVLLAPVVTWTCHHFDSAWLRLPLLAASEATPASGGVAALTPVSESRIAGAGNPASLASEPSSNFGRAAQAPIPSTTRSTITVTEVFCRLAWVLGIVWLAGVVYFLLRLVWGWRVLARLRQSFTPLAEAELATAATAARRVLGISCLPRVVSSPSVQAPISLGIFRPVIVLPESMATDLGPGQLRDVLVHESAHILHRDHAMGLLERVAHAVYWLHPAIYLLQRELAKAREDLCDNYVLRGNNARAYARTLLELSQGVGVSSPAAWTIGILHPRNLEQRIADLVNQDRQPLVRAGRVKPILAAACFVLPAVLVGGIHLDSRQPAESSVPRPPAEMFLSLHAINGYSALAAEHIRDELRLDSRQLQQLADIAQGLEAHNEADSRGLAGLSSRQHRQHYAELRVRARQRAEEARSSIDKLLRAEQRVGLELVNLRQGGGAALANDRVLEALGVNPQQREELRRNRERVTEQMLRLRRESFEHALDVLTPAQIEKLKELHARGYRVDTLATNRPTPLQHGG